MTPEKIANQLRQDASAYSEGFADGYRLAKEQTVDAIPVSFIFDKMSTIYSEYINIQRHIDSDQEAVERRIGIATNLLNEYNALRNLIREWEGNEVKGEE